MAYDKIQFIAYCVYVGGRQAPFPDHLRQFYPGLPNHSLDIARRIDLMGKAMEQAEASRVMAPKNPNILKVFVAPEFFFRGPRGGYSMEEYQETLTKLQALANKRKYKDWLFVFGSIIATSKNESSGRTEAYNVVVVQKGNTGQNGCRVVMKEHKSAKDFLVNPMGDGALDDRYVDYLAPYQASGVGLERQKKEYSGEGVFEMDKICFGAEVCYDHYQQRLRKSAIARDNARVQIQLVPSAGANLEPKSVIAIKDGFAFNCDGLYNTGLGYKPEGLVGHSRLAKVTKAASGKADSTLAEIKPLGYRKVTPNIMALNIFFKGAGQLHFYPTQKIPAASKRSTYQWWVDYKV